MYHTQSNSFSMVFAMANGHRAFEDGEMYSFGSSPAASSSSSSVDCTLSLGTPSTRMSGEKNDGNKEKKRSSYMSGFGWNILPKNTASSQAASAPKGHRGGSTASAAAGGGGDPLLARRCANCDTTSTPLWRNGPRGPKSLCNACGIRFKKEERRATAAAATGGDAQYMMNAAWPSAAAAQHHKTTPCYSSPYGNEFRFAENDVVDYRDSDGGAGGIPFLSWRFNVTDRPSFVHDFTR